MPPEAVEIIAIIVFFVGFFGLITGKGAIKSIVSISVIEASAVMFLLSIGYSAGAMPPIGQSPANPADPLPQALVITAIVIGVALTAVNLTMLISLCRQFKATDWDILKNKSAGQQ
ncbi:MAG: cation:proton antiporter subunit C [Oscillospiraceae bacterium]|nr:cation:proton antiporter subunit C [Oscillospiraceae bacterium]